jgi:hypothetical protein
MSKLTRPLIKHIYSSQEPGVRDTGTLMDLIAHPDAKNVLPRLQEMSEALDTTLFELPAMLEDFGDMYLSLSYYRGFMDELIPKTRAMLNWFKEVSENSHVGKDPMVKHQFEVVDRMLSRTANSIVARFNGFDRNVEVDWDDVSVETFQKVRKMISSHQVSLAEVLCGLMVKVSEWEQKYPDGRASPDKRVSFLMTDIRPGIEQLARVEAGSPRF